MILDSGKPKTEALRVVRQLTSSSCYHLGCPLHCRSHGGSGCARCLGSWRPRSCARKCATEPSSRPSYRSPEPGGGGRACWRSYRLKDLSTRVCVFSEKLCAGYDRDDDGPEYLCLIADSLVIKFLPVHIEIRGGNHNHRQRDWSSDYSFYASTSTPLGQAIRAGLNF